MTPARQAMVDLFQRHVQAELDGDLETTPATMTDSLPPDQHAAHHGRGKFFPPDVEMIPFTHTKPVEWMLPGVAPTGKRVEVPVAVIVKVEGGKIAHEHIYWDQACVLVQLGLLNPKGLPVAGPLDQAGA